MPIYEYQCSKCGHEFDELQKMDDDPLTDCPECKKATLVKLVSAPNFRLKGAGWYETDFKKDKRKNIADDSNGKKPSSDEKPRKADAPSKKDATASSKKESSKPAKVEKK